MAAEAEARGDRRSGRRGGGAAHPAARSDGRARLVAARTLPHPRRTRRQPAAHRPRPPRHRRPRRLRHAQARRPSSPSTSHSPPMNAPGKRSPRPACRFPRRSGRHSSRRTASRLLVSSPSCTLKLRAAEGQRPGNMPAKGNALGTIVKQDKALKGRPHHGSPFQGFDPVGPMTQGVAGLAWFAPLMLRMVLRKSAGENLRILQARPNE